MSIDQDMVDAHGITGAYSSVMSLCTTRSIGPCSNNSAGWLVRPEQSSLVAQKIGHVRVRAFASNDYRLGRGTPQVPEDLLQHDLIAGDTHTEIQQGFEAMGYPTCPLHFGLRTDV